MSKHVLHNPLGAVEVGVVLQQVASARRLLPSAGVLLALNRHGKLRIFADEAFLV